MKEKKELGEGRRTQEEKEEDREEGDFADKWDYPKGKTPSAYFHVVSRKKKSRTIVGKWHFLVILETLPIFKFGDSNKCSDFGKRKYFLYIISEGSKQQNQCTRSVIGKLWSMGQVCSATCIVNKVLLKHMLCMLQ